MADLKTGEEKLTMKQVLAAEKDRVTRSKRIRQKTYTFAEKKNYNKFAHSLVTGSGLSERARAARLTSERERTESLLDDVGNHYVGGSGFCWMGESFVPGSESWDERFACSDNYVPERKPKRPARKRRLSLDMDLMEYFRLFPASDRPQPATPAARKPELSSGPKVGEIITITQTQPDGKVVTRKFRVQRSKEPRMVPYGEIRYRGHRDLMHRGVRL